MREAEAKYRTLVEQLPIATYINDTGMPVRTRYMSPQIETMLGFPVSDWLQRDQLLPHARASRRPRARARRGRSARTRPARTSGCEYRLIAADGRVVWVLDETVAVRDEEYRPLFLQGFLVDVTDRRASDEALRRSEEIHRLVVEGSRDLIALSRSTARRAYASPAVETMLG